MIIHPLDCVAVMRGLIAPESVDAIVTDPPYELGFMGKRWDASGVAFDPETWRAAFAVLKPGAHLVAFSGTRTYHRMVCAIEDAGFEIRDQLAWVYGSGFPKSLDVAKAIDAAAGAERKVVGSRHRATTGRGQQGEGGYAFGENYGLTAPATDAAKRWQGWGTALKPAWEPIVLARKPLIGTVAANYAAHGVGGLNIEGCRVEGTGNVTWAQPRGGIWRTDTAAKAELLPAAGRWPANLCHDGSDEVLACFPQAPGQQRVTTERSANTVYGASSPGTAGVEPRSDSGSAARFFYCAKTSTAEREAGCDALPPKRADEQHKRDRSELDDPRRAGTVARRNHHPTVKPVALMRWLARLVTPPGGTVLDPFTGSGSTGMACKAEGFNFIGCELDAEYVAIAEARIAAYKP